MLSHAPVRGFPISVYLSETVHFSRVDKISVLKMLQIRPYTNLIFSKNKTNKQTIKPVDTGNRHRV